MHPYFLDTEYPNSSLHDSRFHVISVPLERTVSYGSGTANGPAAIIASSGQLEQLVSDHFEPGVHGIHTCEPVDCSDIVPVEQIFNNTAEQIKRAWDLASIPIMLGGEHSVTNGAVRAMARACDLTQVGILQFDAHMDLRDIYDRTPFSHASVMRRAVETGIRLHQVGIRNYCNEELRARNEYGVTYHDAHQLHRLFRSGGEETIHLPDDFPERLYISFDVDAFDASLMSATGTPDPGGLSWWEAVDLLEVLTEGRTIIGGDVVELAPRSGMHHCDYTAAKLIYHLMGLIARRNQFPRGRISS